MSQNEFQEWVKLNLSAIFSSISTLGKIDRENNAAILALRDEVHALRPAFNDLNNYISALEERVIKVEEDNKNTRTRLSLVQDQHNNYAKMLVKHEAAIDDLGKEFSIAAQAHNTPPPHRRLIDEKGEFRDATGVTCVFRRPRQLPGIGELYIGSYSGGITLNYALIEEIIPALQQFLDTGAFPWESPNSQETRKGA